MKKGLILEGGAMRGMFTAGVLDVLIENEVAFDGIVGVSAGAAFGCNYKSNQPGRVIRYNKAYCRDPRYGSWWAWLRSGDLFEAKFCYHELPEKLDPFDGAAFERNPMEFYLVCTDVESGEAVYHRCERMEWELFEWFRASASMPLVSRPVELDGRRLLDGGIADSIPIRFFEGLGYSRNVVILTQPAEYEKRPLRFSPIIRRMLRKYPKVFEVLARRHEVYNETLRYIREQEREGRLFVFRPDSRLKIGHIEHHPDRLQTVYDLGRAMGTRRLAEIRDFFR